MTNPTKSVRVLSREELRTEKGIRFSRVHLGRKIKAKTFPAPIKLGENSNGWVEFEIDQWLNERIAERDREQAVA